MELPKQITNDKCLICGYEISSMNWSDYNGQVWCPKCGLTYQRIECKLKEEYLKSLGKTKKDVKVPYCDIEEMIPLIKEYFELTGKSAGQGAFMGTGQDYVRDGIKSGNTYPVEAKKEFNKWVIENYKELEKEFGDGAGIDWEKCKEIKNKNRAKK